VLGGLLAVISAATFAFNNASLRRGVLTGSVAQAMTITVPIGVPLFLVAAIATGSIFTIAGFSRKAITALVAAGLIHFLWGRYCNYRATRAIGANLAAPVQQVNLLISLSLAIIVLHETLTPLKMLGIVLVVLGPYFALRQKTEKSDKPENKAAAAVGDGKETKIEIESAHTFKPRYAEGILFALFSATGYGSSPILIRMALEDKGLAVSLTGGLIAYSSATIVLGLLLLWPGNLRHALAVNRVSLKWFTLSGVLVCISQMFIYMAVSIAPVTVVTPISRLSIVFRLYASKLLNPQHEVFGGKIVFGTVLSLLGALLVSLQSDAIAEVVHLPPALLPLLFWQWPQWQ
jgi:drug/metabolite transporter (DMT)-like permease